VRMLPPLIIEEPDIADAISRIDRAAERIERAQREKQEAGKEAVEVNS
jgi:acetylornithine/succinyldiaminopimelate/putrescine aminotransferase